MSDSNLDVAGQIERVKNSEELENAAVKQIVVDYINNGEKPLTGQEFVKTVVKG